MTAIIKNKVKEHVTHLLLDFYEDDIFFSGEGTDGKRTSYFKRNYTLDVKY